MELEKISVIVPVYKVEKYLKRCVESIVQQTYQNIEIILVDDGSPDRCPEMCDEYARRDARIKVIHKSNGGLSDARNVGLRIATGEFILYVDSDDYIELDACERLLKGMKKGVDLVVGVCREVNKSKITYQKHTNLKNEKIYSAKEYVIQSIKKNEWYAPACLNLYRRCFLLDHNLYYKVGYCFEDMEMLPRLFLANPTVCYIDYAFYNYMIRENSIMTSGFTDEKKEMAVDNYRDWMILLNSVEDAEYQKILYGILVRYYVSTARRMKIYGWKVEGLDFSFAWKYALSMREKLKVLLFNCFPSLYTKL